MAFNSDNICVDDRLTTDLIIEDVEEEEDDCNYEGQQEAEESGSDYEELADDCEDFSGGLVLQLFAP